jgi:hypothetical protein
MSEYFDSFLLRFVLELFEFFRRLGSRKAP